jgi:predicted cobalt transporter CbtA
MNGIDVRGHSERWVVRLGIRTVPWLIAAAGLGIPLLADGFAGWPYVLLWVILLIVPWIVTRDQPESRRERLVLPMFLLPVLSVLGFIGGWYLIPADVAWLLIEFGDRRGRTGLPRTTAS